MRRREELSLVEKLYVWEIVKGVYITFGRLLRNLFFHIMHLFGLAKETRAAASIQYPSERRDYPARYRGQHRLTLKDDGDIYYYKVVNKGLFKKKEVYIINMYTEKVYLIDNDGIKDY